MEWMDKRGKCSNQKSFCMSFCPKKTTNARRCIISDQTFPILKERGVLKVKNKVRNEILKMDTSEH